MGAILSKLSSYLLTHSNKSIYMPETDSDSDSSLDTEGNREEFQESSSEDSHYAQSALGLGENALSFDAGSTTDAINYTKPAQIKVRQRIDVKLIENSLEYYEKVSLIFLLYDNAPRALDDLKALMEFPQNILKQWSDIQQRQNNNKWEDQLIEALCLIKNFSVLKKYGGYSKNELSLRLLPQHLFVSVQITKYKKVLYYLCEQLNQLEVEKLVNAVRSDFEQNKLSFRQFDYLYLELYLLHWEQCNYISPNNLTNLYRKLKQLDFFELADKLKETLMPEFAVKPNTSVYKVPSKKPKETFDKILSSNTGLTELCSMGSTSNDNSGANSSYSLDECLWKYDIDPENPGICLIINQENFYRDVNPKFKHLLPQHDKPLDHRKGTEKDRDDLKKTFQNFGYRPIVVNNLTHEEIIEKVRMVSKSVKHESSLFVCILSHGDEGVVYGVNCCHVKVTKIQNIMCNNKKLAGKPKVLILQSCQGDRCQPIGNCDDDDLEIDGPSQSLPAMLDLFTFWATVPGYGAIRHTNKGSWFIQSLCDKLPKLSSKHDFDDICTQIIRDVTQKRWVQKKGEVAMVPLKSSTFSKKLFLPHYKNTSLE